MNLPVLAQRLAREQQRTFDEMDAASWLVQSWKTQEVQGGKVVPEPSPFAQCASWGVFYSDTNPEDLLEPCEIESCERVARMKRGRNGALRDVGE